MSPIVEARRHIDASVADLTDAQGDLFAGNSASSSGTQLKDAYRRVDNITDWALQTYLTTLGRIPGEELAGVLLYPQVDDPVDMTATVGTHSIRVKTVDLTGSAARICDQLMDVVEASGLRVG